MKKASLNSAETILCHIKHYHRDWFDDNGSLEISLAKRRSRYLERVWRRTRSPLDISRCSKQLHLCNRMMSKSKTYYYTILLSNKSDNPRHMWNSVNKILHREISKPLPDHTSLDTLCSSFSKFFTDKITLIRSNFVTNDHSHNFPESPHVENTMAQFTPTTTSEVRSIILKSTNASLAHFQHVFSNTILMI